MLHAMEFFGLYYRESLIFLNRGRIRQDRFSGYGTLRFHPVMFQSLSFAGRFFTGREKCIT